MSNDKAEILTEADLTDMQGRHAEYFTDGTLVALNLDSVVSTVRKMAGLLEEAAEDIVPNNGKEVQWVKNARTLLARYKGE